MIEAERKRRAKNKKKQAKQADSPGPLFDGWHRVRRTGSRRPMKQALMTPDAKSALSKIIRGLRTRLLDDLHASTEGAYRLSLKAKDAKLGEAARIQRERLETWVAEQVRALPKKDQAGASERFRLEVEKEAAYTLLNRIVFLRLLVASELRAEKVATGGWESRRVQAVSRVCP